MFSADLFYHPDFSLFDTMESMGVLAVEMEAAGLYGVAAEYGAAALAILTISDHVRTGEATSADERQSTFNDMVEIALESSSTTRGPAFCGLSFLGPERYPIRSSSEPATRPHDRGDRVP